MRFKVAARDPTDPKISESLNDIEVSTIEELIEKVRGLGRFEFISPGDFLNSDSEQWMLYFYNDYD